MDKVIRNGIVEILRSHSSLLKISLRQKSKFEGWLKFELANYLEDMGMRSVEVETKGELRYRHDITFFHNETPHKIELKTPNTNWQLKGVNIAGRPITKNIQSIIDDAKKMNSNFGICAFVLFPVPTGDSRWETYLDRISEGTGIQLRKESHCDIVTLEIDSMNKCDLVVCAFRSRQFSQFR